MPDQRRHRGPHPEDARLFEAGEVPRMRRAVAELSWLLTRGYAERSALKLVGDRHALRQRQRVAVMRCACADEARRNRRLRQLEPAAAAGGCLLIDGYNVLTTVESALAGGVLLVGRDGCLRDMASMHGSYRKVAETQQAVTLIGRTLEDLAISPACWLLDAPVSNSGRLRALMADAAHHAGWPWQIEIVPSPDHRLMASDEPIATADSVVLDAGGPWLNLAGEVVRRHVERPWRVDLGATDSGPPSPADA
jgi:hypothetical protein